jgi:hypothetical protein
VTQHEQEPLKVCPDRVLPAAQQWEATQFALNEREGNTVPPSTFGDAIAHLEEIVGSDAPKREALVMFTFKRWGNGRTISFYFLDGPDWAQQKAFSYMMRWTAEANLKFAVTQDRLASDVRVTFEPGGSWSYLGTDNLGIPEDEPTMQFGWLLDDPGDEEEWRRVCVHESGHMIGFGHEQAPNRTFEFNEEAVFSYYGGPPNYWSREETYQQVIQKYQGPPVTNFSAYDKTSIMHYAIPTAFVKDPADAIPWNSERSRNDKRYAALWYPKPSMEAAIARALDELARAAEQQLEGSVAD